MDDTDFYNEEDTDSTGLEPIDDVDEWAEDDYSEEDYE